MGNRKVFCFLFFFQFIFYINALDTSELLRKGSYSEVIDYFKNNLAEINKLKGSNKIPLLYAIDNENVEACKALIELGSDPNISIIKSKSIIDPESKETKTGTINQTAIEAAINKNNWQIVEFLVAAGVETNTNYEFIEKQPVVRLIDKAAENWINLYKTYKDFMNTNRISKNALATAANASKNMNYGPSEEKSYIMLGYGIVSIFSEIALSTVPQKKILSAAKILGIIYNSLHTGTRIPKEREFYGENETIYTLENISKITFRDMALDFSVILGNPELVKRSILENSQPTPMTLVYIIEFDRSNELSIINAFGYLPINIINRFPIIIDDEVFQTPIIYAYFKNSKNVLNLLINQ
jgi:hypothetical protein